MNILLRRYIIFTCSISIICIISIIISKVLFIIVTVKNNSMRPSLEDLDRVLAIRYSSMMRLDRGDVVLVWPPRIPQDRRFSEVAPNIKRIIGLPGDAIAIPPAEGQRYPDESERCWSWYVPPGHIFVCGDNLENSLDSRTWGPIPATNILAVVVLKLPRRRDAADA